MIAEQALRNNRAVVKLLIEKINQKLKADLRNSFQYPLLAFDVSPRPLSLTVQMQVLSALWQVP